MKVLTQNFPYWFNSRYHPNYDLEQNGEFEGSCQGIVLALFKYFRERLYSNTFMTNECSDRTIAYELKLLMSALYEIKSKADLYQVQYEAIEKQIVTDLDQGSCLDQISIDDIKSNAAFFFVNDYIPALNRSMFVLSSVNTLVRNILALRFQNRFDTLYINIALESTFGFAHALGMVLSPSLNCFFDPNDKIWMYQGHDLFYFMESISGYLLNLKSVEGYSKMGCTAYYDS